MKAILTVFLFSLSLTAQDTSCPMHDTKSNHQADVEKNGDMAMGFSHDKTTHHFRLSPDGGAIEVTVNNPQDTENLRSVRMHLQHIAAMFSNGDFSIPMFVHGEVPPGTTEMKDRRSDIHYTFEDLPTGGQVRIATSNPDALNAIHDFLNFQITDHHTGDPIEP